MDSPAHEARLAGLDRPRGAESRCLSIGNSVLLLEGLDAALARALDRRWGGFLGPCGERVRPDYTVRVLDAGTAGWLEHWSGPEPYRLQPLSRPGAVSYHFAIAVEGDPRRWRLGLSEPRIEPVERAADNALRYLAARLALDLGGFALHGAAVLSDGRARVLAGPSGAGKSTAVRLALPALSLGDDFALVWPEGRGWSAPAVPFDNSERIEHEPPRGTFPLTGIYRLQQADALRVESLPRARAVAALLACVAFPWATPDLADELLERVTRFVDEATFELLHFRHDSDLWRDWLDRRD